MLNCGNLVPVVAALEHYGYLGAAKANAPGETIDQWVRAALAFFQRLHGINETGQPTDETLDAMLKIPRCGNDDHAEVMRVGLGNPQAAISCRWPSTHYNLKVFLASLPQMLTAPAWRSIFLDVFAAIAEVTPLRFTLAAAQQEANVLVFAGREDGPRNTLAWCELPCFGTGAPRAIRMKLDKDEVWAGRGVQTGVDGFLVVLHEQTHGIGVPHIAPARGVALMNPSFNNRLKGFTDLDREEIWKLYPRPTTPAQPQPPGIPPTAPPAPGGNEIVLMVGGREVYRGVAPGMVKSHFHYVSPDPRIVGKVVGRHIAERKQDDYRYTAKDFE